MQKLLTFFQQKKSSIFAIFNDQSFNYMLTYNIVSFEQLGPEELVEEKREKYRTVKLGQEELVEEKREKYRRVKEKVNHSPETEEIPTYMNLLHPHLLSPSFVLTMFKHQMKYMYR